VNRHIAIRCCFIIAAAVPGSLMGQTPSLPSLDAALRTEPDAQKLANLIWSTTFVRCGDTYFAFEEEPLSAVLVEYKKPTFALVPIKLSATDELNGIQWRGRAQMDFVASRSIEFKAPQTLPVSMREHPQQPTWTEWIPRDSLFHVGFRMTRKNGRWSVPQLYTNSALISRRLSCKDVTAKEPFAGYQLPESRAFGRAQDELDKMKWDDFNR